MIIYDTIEQDGRRFAHAQSSLGYLIEDAQGRLYADAAWPYGETRDFAETRIPINSEDGQPVPRRWTPLAIKRACGERWATLKAALVDADLYEDFMMAQELVETDAAFARGYAWAVAQYGAEAVEAILSAATE